MSAHGGFDLGALLRQADRCIAGGVRAGRSILGTRLIEARLRGEAVHVRCEGWATDPHGSAPAFDVAIDHVTAAFAIPLAALHGTAVADLLDTPVGRTDASVTVVRVPPNDPSLPHWLREWVEHRSESARPPATGHRPPADPYGTSRPATPPI